jgi:N-acetylneuraminate synthase/sialic acid synthase
MAKKKINVVRITTQFDLTVSDESEAFVIAEIGHNHQGSVELCEKFFRAAADAGASAVKLQKRSNINLLSVAGC